MSTAVTMVWRVSFNKESLTDDEIYYIEFSSNLDKSVPDKIAKELERLGYKFVKQNLLVTFPP